MEPTLLQAMDPVPAVATQRRELEAQALMARLMAQEQPPREPIHCRLFGEGPPAVSAGRSYPGLAAIWEAPQHLLLVLTAVLAGALAGLCRGSHVDTPAPLASGPGHSASWLD